MVFDESFVISLSQYFLSLRSFRGILVKFFKIKAFIDSSESIGFRLSDNLFNINRKIWMMNGSDFIKPFYLKSAFVLSNVNFKSRKFLKNSFFLILGEECIGF